MSILTRDIEGVAHFLAQKRAVNTQGILSGANPAAVNTSDPLRLWIIQVVIIITLSQGLALILKRIKQPKVIAEILGGLILGPTVMGRIPGFTENIFPSASLPFLSLVANIGLVLFLFLVGLEIDAQSVKRNTRMSLLIATGALLLPFAIGSGMSKLIYDNLIDHKTTVFSHFLLFTATSYSITAFPVLCRILTELKLLDTTVGVCVLSAGVGNDLCGWTLLALTVAMVNASTGMMALYVLLCTIAWVLFLLFPVKIALTWLARRSGSVDTGPTVFFMTVTMSLVFISAFYTDVIGVHPIFGGFLAGLIIPRDGGLAIAIAEKIEDLVAVTFLPLYFALSGLSTNLGLLNTGKVWGITMMIIFADWFGKFTGATLGARIAGFKLREAATVGTFMSCKGLVELVVLNIGLQAGILSNQVFSMFVLDALVLTFCTTPVAEFLYPPSRRIRASTALDRTKSSIESGSESPTISKPEASANTRRRSRFMVVLEKFDDLPGMMYTMQLLFPKHTSHGRSSKSSSVNSVVTGTATAASALGIDMSIYALRLLELTDRTSAVIKSAYFDSLAISDHLLRIVRTFCDVNGVSVQTDLSLVAADHFAQSVLEHVVDSQCEMVLASWALPVVVVSDAPGASGGNSEAPIDTLFNPNTAGSGSSTAQFQFVRDVFSRSSVDAGLFLDRRAPGDHSTSSQGGPYRIFLPFIGGEDDRCALELVMQICSTSNIRAVVVRFQKVDHETETQNSYMYEKQVSVLGGAPMNLSVISSVKLQRRLADDIAWQSAASLTSADPEYLKHVKFEHKETSTPLRSLLTRVDREAELAKVDGGGRLLTFIGRSITRQCNDIDRDLAALSGVIGGATSDLRKSVGDLGAVVALSGLQTDIMIIQSSVKSISD